MFYVEWKLLDLLAVKVLWKQQYPMSVVDEMR